MDEVEIVVRNLRFKSEELKSDISHLNTRKNELTRAVRNLDSDITYLEARQNGIVEAVKVIEEVHERKTK